jgi:transposase
MNTIKKAFNIGVDVGKHQLDFFCHENGEYFQVPNTPEGIRKALKQLKPLSISRLVVEATGRHEQALVLAATRQQIPVVVAQPIAVRRFAGASLNLKVAHRHHLMILHRKKPNRKC